MEATEDVCMICNEQRSEVQKKVVI
jgi:hypothetical protein